LLGTGILFATTIEEYNELIFQLKNYNTPGFTVLYLNDSGNIEYERGTITNIEFPLCLIPYQGGLFQFSDKRTNEICYARNFILRVDIFGRICNLDGFPLTPEIKVDISKPYNITFSEDDMKIIINYQDEINSTEEYKLNLYWPQKLDKPITSGSYFYFDGVTIFKDAKVLSGFFENSATNVQVVIAQMMKLISEMKNQYGDNLVFNSGSIENTLSLLNALFISSYNIKPEPGITTLNYDMKKMDFGFLGHPEITFEIPISGGPSPNVDPLKINHLIQYLTINVTTENLE
jgi:hypothetical protein